MTISKYQEAKKLKQEGKLESAITAYQQAIELNPNFYSYYHELGEVLSEKDDWEGAIASFSKAIELNPKSAWSHHNLGEAFRKIGRYAKAIEQYRQAIKLKPKYAGFCYSLGEAFRQQGKLAKAVNWYLKTVQINPNYSRAYLNLAEILIKQGKLQEATTKLEQAIEVNPNCAEYYQKLGDVFDAKGNIESALASYQKMMAIHPLTKDERQQFQAQLEATQSQLAETQIELEQAKFQSNQTITEEEAFSQQAETESLLNQSLELLAKSDTTLNESLEKYRQSQEALNQYKTELEQTKTERKKLQEKLHQTEAVLNQSLKQLDETEAVLNLCFEKVEIQSSQEGITTPANELQKELTETQLLLNESLEQLEQSETLLGISLEKLAKNQTIDHELSKIADNEFEGGEILKSAQLKYAIFTTFSPKGYQEYGRRMLETFARYLPLEVDIYAYYEGEKPDFQNSRVYYRDLEAASPDLVEFKKECDRDPVKCGRGGKKYNMQQDARRFAHKTFCVIHATQNIDADIAYWFDADTVALRDISMSFIQSLLPPEYYTSYLGRGETYSECGFVGYNIKHPAHQEFMDAWRQVYLSGKLFELPQWHDCTSYDYVRTRLEQEAKIYSKNLSGKLITGHPFVNTVLGEYFDHLKGPKRKKLGESLAKDFVVTPSERLKEPSQVEAETNSILVKENFNQYRKKVTSQFGEDGIIEAIFKKLGIDKGWCVEFGAADGKRLSNTWNLWHNLGWNAVLIEGDKTNYKELLESTASFQNVISLNDFVSFEGENTLDNILAKTNIPQDFELLSIDIDGDDFYVWDSLKKHKPKVIIIEHNPTFPPHIEFVDIMRKAGKAGFGSSAKAMAKLGKQKGYELIACTISNSFFLEKSLFDKLNIKVGSLEELFPVEGLRYMVFSYKGQPFLIPGNVAYGGSFKKMKAIANQAKTLEPIPPGSRQVVVMPANLFNKLINK